MGNNTHVKLLVEKKTLKKRGNYGGGMKWQI
jgi:hypothetical protein